MIAFTTSILSSGTFCSSTVSHVSHINTFTKSTFHAIPHRSNNRASSLSLLKMQDDKTIVEEYFNNTGFERWNKIYSEDKTINTVQQDIRTGHNQTVQVILNWIDEDKNANELTFCDAGCGVGSLSIPLAKRQAKFVSASDISQAMVKEARSRAEMELDANALSKIEFTTKDLESIDGVYDTVCCIDVMIHYPDEKIAEMIQHLASVSSRRLIITFAPYTLLLGALKSFGSLFPGPSKATRAYLHKESDVVDILQKLGWTIKRTDFIKSKFYFSKIIEAVKE